MVRCAFALSRWCPGRFVFLEEANENNNDDTYTNGDDNDDDNDDVYVDADDVADDIGCDGALLCHVNNDDDDVVDNNDINPSE